ncbi:MAG: hypothetical protein R2787_13660 [Saprospiraceae bacterium]
MWKVIFIGFFLIAFINSAFVQEICDNGWDDDGDGLVDLYDDECICEGISILVDYTDKIPNPDFELYNLCPTAPSQMDYCTDWGPGSNGTPDYMNDCGWIAGTIVTNGLIPFPSGNGIAGTIFADTWKEYITTCLNSPLEAGTTYTLSFYLASSPLGPGGPSCGPITYGTVNVTVFGNATCDFPFPGLGCPPNADPNWIELGHVTYDPVTQWQQVSIVFTPSTDINGFMIGSPCNLPPGYSAFGGSCNPYFIYDDLHLNSEEDDYNLTILDIGDICDDDFSLFDPGTWQWYWNGVALTGQTGQELLLSGNNYQSGMYQVVFTSREWLCDGQPVGEHSRQGYHHGRIVLLSG